MSFEPKSYDEYDIGGFLPGSDLRRKWIFVLDGKERILILDENLWNGSKTLKLDDKYIDIER